jgi:hypothetical protein
MESRSKAQRIFEIAARNDAATMQLVPQVIPLTGGNPSGLRRPPVGFRNTRPGGFRLTRAGR